MHKDLGFIKLEDRAILCKLFIMLLLVTNNASKSNAEENSTMLSIRDEQANNENNIQAPAPMGVHWGNTPSKGKITITIMPTFENHSGWLIGTKGASSAYIVSTTPTFIPSTTNPSPFMRIIPQDVTASIQNAKVAYGISDKISMLMTASIIQKQLFAKTFFGDFGGLPIGGNYVGTKGFSDLTTSVIYKLYEDKSNRAQLSSGLAYPLSSNTAKMSLFLPNATYDIERAHYAFQPGPRTLDFLTGIL